MLRRESGQILPGLIMLMLAILAIGTLAFTVGKAAVLRSDAQTAADAAALAGARNIRDQLIAQVATTGTSDFARVNESLVRAAATTYARKNDARLTQMKMEGADVRAWVTTEEKIDPPKENKEGKASARARVELVAAVAGPTGAGGGGGTYDPISEAEWKALAKKIKQPADCDDLYTLGRFLQSHGAITGENARLGDPPKSTADGERSKTSWHYKCGNSGAIDLNYAGNEKGIIDSQIDWFQKLGFNTIWQEPNHYDHVHINPGTGAGIDLGGGAAGPLQDTFLEVKLVDWDAPAPVGLAAQFVGGPGGIPFGPPDPRVANAMCDVLDRMNVSPKVRLAAWETAIVESGVKALDWGDRDSEGPFQQRPSKGWGTPEQVRDPYYATAEFVRRAKRIEHKYADPGDLAQAVQISGHPERYAQRAGQAAALNDKFCG